MIAATFQSLLQGFFTDRLLRQRQASPHTIAGYRDTFRLLFRFAADQLGKTPSTLTTEDFQPAFVGRFLEHLEQRARQQQSDPQRAPGRDSLVLSVCRGGRTGACPAVPTGPRDAQQTPPAQTHRVPRRAGDHGRPRRSRSVDVDRPSRSDPPRRRHPNRSARVGIDRAPARARRDGHVARTSGATGRDGNNGARHSAATPRPSWTAGSDGTCPQRVPACFRAFAVARSVAMRSKNSWPVMHNGRSTACPSLKQKTGQSTCASTFVRDAAPCPWRRPIRDRAVAGP